MGEIVKQNTFKHGYTGETDIKQYHERIDELWRIKRSLQFEIIETSFERHDSTNLETTLTYKREEKNADKQHYQIQFIFFFPETLLPHDYSSRKFLESLTNNMRLRGADIAPSEFLDLENPNSPLAQLESLSQELLKKPQLCKHQELIDHTRSAAAYIIQALKSLEISDYFMPGYDIAAHYKTELALSQSLVGALRRILEQFETVFARRLGETISSLRLIDEFISFNIEKRWISVLKLPALQHNPELLKAIRNMLKTELENRQQSSFLVKTEPKALEDTNSAEIFRHRLGILKRFVQNRLYLNVKYVKTSSYIVQTIAMLAAGLAASFAYSMEFINRGQLTPAWQLNTGAFIAISTFVYVLKDRLKELVRMLLQNKFRSYDLRRKISLQESNSKYFAETREQISILSADHLNKELAPWVLKLRRELSTGNIGVHRREKVVIYTKNLSIDWETLNEKHEAQHKELKEIYRFSLHDFLERMDNPLNTEQFFDPHTEEVVNLDIPRVYHLNIILSISPLLNNKTVVENARIASKFRIVLNKKGIQRVENVVNLSQ